jgi:5S rRNA maturation endonuclease (ribonuclease M5)
MGNSDHRLRPRAAALSIDPFEEFLDLWRTLQTESRVKGTAILVEGERDRQSLRRLGILGPIVLVHQGRSLARTAHELATSGKRVIILTDWDVEGGHLAQRLRLLLEAGSLSVDLEQRRRMARALRGEVVHVEGLARWARRNAERLGASLDHFLTPGEG